MREGGSDRMEKFEHSIGRDHLFHNQFPKETDRAAVILSTAMLEQSLETLLKSRLVPLPDGDDKLFDGPYAPLASFSAKIDMAYRMGLISVNLCRDLHLIRKIRNDFAHDVSNCSFEDVKTKERIIQLIRSSDICNKVPEIRAKGFPAGPRGDFQISVSWILWSLDSSVEKMDAIMPKPLEFGYNKNMTEKMLEQKIDNDTKGVTVPAEKGIPQKM